MQNPFDWEYLTTPPASGDVFDAFTIVYLALFLAGFVIAAYLYYRPWTKPFGKLFRRRAVIKATGIAMWIFGIGMFFFLIRLLQINPLTFGEPFWMWLSFLAILVLFAWIGLSWTGARKARMSQPGLTQPHARRAAPLTQQAKRPVRRKTTLH